MLQNAFNNKVKNDSLLFVILILSLLKQQLLSPADNLCKQFGPRSRPTERRS